MQRRKKLDEYIVKTEDLDKQLQQAPEGESYLASIWRRFKRHKLGMFSLILLIVVIALALLAPVIAPHDPNRITSIPGSKPSGEHLLGIDLSGRDVLSRLFFATRISLFVGVLVTIISTTIGVTLGLMAG